MEKKKSGGPKKFQGGSGPACTHTRHGAIFSLVPREQSDPVTARTRLNLSSAEAKGSMQHGKRQKVAYRAPAAQACITPFPRHNLAVKMCNFKRKFLKCWVPWLRQEPLGAMTAVSFVNVLRLLIIRVPRLPGVNISEEPNSAVGQPRNSHIPPEAPNLS